jgi:hypothetical protein
MHSVQKTELLNNKEQKAADRENPAKKILQIRQKAHTAQGGKIVHRTFAFNRGWREFKFEICDVEHVIWDKRGGRIQR